MNLKKGSAHVQIYNISKPDNYTKHRLNCYYTGKAKGILSFPLNQIRSRSTTLFVSFAKARPELQTGQGQSKKRSAPNQWHLSKKAIFLSFLLLCTLNDFKPKTQPYLSSCQLLPAIGFPRMYKSTKTSHHTWTLCLVTRPPPLKSSTLGPPVQSSSSESSESSPRAPPRAFVTLEAAVLLTLVVLLGVGFVVFLGVGRFLIWTEGMNTAKSMESSWSTVLKS